MSSSVDLAAVSKFLREDDGPFLLTTHEYPDPDGIGSCIALMAVLKALGKDVQIILPDAVNPRYAFLNKDNRLENIYKYDVSRLKDLRDSSPVFVLLDCGFPNRAGSVLASIAENAKKIVVIDHHVPADLSGLDAITYIDTGAIATGQVIYRILSELKFTFSFDVAQAIYAALMVDSGSFRFERTNEETYAIAGEMVGHGVVPQEIYNRLFQNYPLSRLQLMRESLESLSLHHENRTACQIISQAMLARCSAHIDQTEEFVNLPFQAAGVAVSAIFKEDRGSSKVRISLRSQTDFDVQKIATQFGGGGHQKAAACRFDGSLAKCVTDVVKAIGAAYPA